MNTSAAIQLAFGVIAMLLIFAVALGTKRTVSIGVLLVMIPFQVIDTKYASSSVLLAYVLFAILLMTGGLKLRMMPSLMLIALAYFASLAMADRNMMQFHVLFIFQFFSCLLVFLLAYNFATLVHDEKSVMDVILAINVLALVYCALQLTVGPGERFVPLGIDEFKFNLNRNPGDPRLVGPFGNPGSTAGYFSLMALYCAVDYFVASGRRRLLVGIVAGCNLLALVATGNRAGFLVLLAMFMGLLFVFRTELGARRMVQYAVSGAVVLTIAAVIAVTYTDFNRLFARMETVTETKNGLPATRQGGWPVAIEKIKEHPWFGEGPHFWTEEDAEAAGQSHIEYEDTGELETVYDPYPHSLYLYLLRTVGVFGLAAVVGFFIRVWFILRAALQRDPAAGYRSAILKLGYVLIPAFLVAQITLEFHRPTTMDYAQLIFALMGLFVGVSDRAPVTATAAAPLPDVRSQRLRHPQASRVEAR
jgi:O-antigen ligase